MKKSILAVGILISLAFIISLVTWLIFFPGVRHTFMFQSFDDDSLRMEVRYLPRNPVQGRLSLFVDELLLGPETERFRPLFTRGTRAESCFLRDGTLYVTLSTDLLTEGNGALPLKKGFSLFKKNILHNFRNIKQIDIFVDGKLIYEELSAEVVTK
ncbi:MAG: GerMN domain-containing protein [Treponema sp.]|nr:GerMN domain-containing protein [Treponema sp.]